jgi:hypothetical protein
MRQLSCRRAARASWSCEPVLCSVLLGLGCSAGEGSWSPGTLGAMPAEPAGRCELPAAGYSDDCNTCLAARCCEPIESCKEDSQCAEQLSCEVQCQLDSDPPGCSQRCFASGPHGLYTPYDDCSFAECRSSCWM